MKRVLGVLLAAVVSLAAMPAGTVVAAQDPAADPAALATIGKGLVSHRALYDVGLGRHDPRNYRSAVGGGLSLEFMNTCEGYVLNQRFVIETTTDDGGQLSDMTLGSFESHDGRRFRFRLREQVNGEDDEDLIGEGELAQDGGAGRIVFSKPEDTEIKLPAGTMFPTEHTIRLIEAARAGRTWLQASVYDGSSAESYSEVGGFIGKAQPPEEGSKPVLAPLKGQKSWRVRLGYFSSAKRNDTPDYEIAFRLYENGVADDIIFDYGDYAIRASLRSLKLLPGEKC